MKFVIALATVSVCLTACEPGGETAGDIPVLLGPTADLPANFDRINARDVAQSAGNAVSGGLSGYDALRAITSVPAVIYGLADRIGSIEAGKEAGLSPADGCVP